MIEYSVKYKGNIYSNIGYFFLGKKHNNFIIIEDENLPKIIDTFCEFEEFDNCLILKQGNIYFDLIEDKPIFDKKYDDSRTINFNKETLRATGEKLSLNTLNMISIDNPNVRPSIIKFVSTILDLNENIKAHIETSPNYLSFPNDKILAMNFFNMVIFNLPEYEKIINSNNINFLKTNLNKETFEISEASKLHQVVGLPKFAINSLKEMKMEEYMEPIKNLANIIDGNSLKIVLIFLERGKLIFENNFSGKDKVLRKEKMTSFLNYLTRILERGNYKVTDLLNYFLRQSFYSSSKGYFTFPINEAMYLSDYLDMCEKYGLKAEKYPSQLRRMHDIVAKNISSLEHNSKELEDEFKKAVDLYRSVEKDISITLNLDDGSKITKEYSFIVPTCIKDIVEEGNDLHHCVGSYTDKIINKSSRVVFMRLKENIKESLVTIDIDNNFHLVEAKKAFNEDIDDEQRKALNKWLKEIAI